ncbi:radical SAM protein [Candidatus Woesearchaeota archaeon]|nr:radical SAM protein [Candidatus Woesearchaeota archaeon]
MIFFQTERGCPQACSFCTNNIMRELYRGKGNTIRTHSVNYCIEELKSLKERFPSIGVFDIRDETFTIRNIKWIREFCERYKKEIGIRFKCLAEPASMSSESMSEEKMRLLVDAGLTDIIIGIQSGSDRVNFEIFNRFITQEQLLKCARVANKFSDKLAVMYDLITTNPYETPEDIMDTIKLLMKIPPPFYLSVNNLIYFEGTPLYKQALKDGYIKSEKDSLLIRDGMVSFNLKNKFPTYLTGSMISAVDAARENVAKPIYHSMPVSFKLWYDKVRYHA